MTERFDIVVIGSGAAGLSVALGARGARVAVVTRGVIGLDGASCWAQGGIAAAIGPGDSAAQHALDTIVAGSRTNQRTAVRWMTESATDSVQWLMSKGMVFDRQQQHFALSRETAHSFPRTLHAGGDATGAELMRALRESVEACPWIEVFEFCEALRLRRHGNHVVGVRVRDNRDVEVDLLAEHVVLATGGLGQLYLHTTNPVECDGTGIALAHMAGAELADLEFVQFHPTALAPRANQEFDQLPLLTEGLRGAGATLVDEAGQRLMSRVHQLGDLAPRDVMSRAIAVAQLEGRRVFLDSRALGNAIERRFPTVFAACMAFGLDPRLEPVPVVPAAHYAMGGVKVDLHSRSSVPGLYAVGEVACTGVHGANRLGSAAILEAVSFGRELGGKLARAPNSRSAIPDDDGGSTSVAVSANERAVIQKVKEIMTQSAGVIRTAVGMIAALDGLDALERSLLPGTRALDRILVARLVLEAALARNESIGSHYVARPAADRGWHVSVA